MALLSMHVWAEYGKDSWEGYGLWIYTPGFPPLAEVLADMMRRIILGPDQRGLMTPDEIQLLIQTENVGDKIDHLPTCKATDLPTGKIKPLAWNKLPPYDPNHQEGGCNGN